MTMLPHVLLTGSPRQQGRQHGQAVRDRVHHNRALYFDRFRREAHIEPDEVLARARQYWPVIQAADPAYAGALEGLAEGSGVDLMDLVALNVRYEILYHQFSARAGVDGCSAFALLPDRTAEGHLLLGQNWDWIPGVQGVLLQTAGESVDTLAFSEAGIVGAKIGLNSAGLGLAINGLMSTADDWARLGLPFHVRCHQILRATTLATAEAVALAKPRACSANYLLARRPAEVVDLETAPATYRRLEPADGMLLHTNHFLDPAVVGVVEPREDTIPRSIHRYTRCQALFSAGDRLAVADVMAHLRDHEGYPRQSVCRHPDPTIPEAERYETVVSVVMDLDARRMWISDGPPCASAYAELALPMVGGH
jgi:isopenicillin-N N-acyltransferase like protein